VSWYYNYEKSTMKDVQRYDLVHEYIDLILSAQVSSMIFGHILASVLRP